MKSNERRIDRRAFLKGAALSGAAAALSPMVIPGSALGLDGAVAPSAKVNMGAIGIGSRGGHDLGIFLSRPDVRFRAICDIRRVRREAVRDQANQTYNDNECAMYKDMEDLLIRDDIDAVLIATGDRWHTMASREPRACRRRRALWNRLSSGHATPQYRQLHARRRNRRER